MPDPTDERTIRKRMERIEFLLNEAEENADPQTRARTREIVQGVMDMHGAALERILETVAASGEGGLALIDALAQDDLVASVLLLYGLHPLDLETRVRQALDKVRPQLRSHGGDVELLGVADGAVPRHRSGGSAVRKGVMSSPMSQGGGTPGQ